MQFKLGFCCCCFVLLVELERQEDRPKEKDAVQEQDAKCWWAKGNVDCSGWYPKLPCFVYKWRQNEVRYYNTSSKETVGLISQQHDSIDTMNLQFAIMVSG